MKTVRLLKPDIFRFEETLWFLDRGFDDCLYTLKSHAVTKAIRVQNEILLFEVTMKDNALLVQQLNTCSLPHMEQIMQQYLLEWFDLERDLQPFYDKAKNHRIVSNLVNQFAGLRLIMIPDLFEALCWCIIGQQINLSFAHKMKTGLVTTYGEHVEHNGQKHFVFPKPSVLAELSIDDLKALQFSRQKADYTINLARLFAEGNINQNQIRDLNDTAKIISELCKIRGVGEWTANYAAMKTFGRRDAITFGDAGLLNGIKTLSQSKQKPTRQEVENFFTGLEGWEAYTVFYVWRSLS